MGGINNYFSTKKSSIMSAVCGLEFHDDTGDVLGARIEATRAGIKAFPFTFVTPPFTDAGYSAQELALTTTYSAYKRGGDAQKPAYDTQLAAANLMMDDTATYADGLIKGKELML